MDSLYVRQNPKVPSDSEGISKRPKISVTHSSASIAKKPPDIVCANVPTPKALFSRKIKAVSDMYAYIINEYPEAALPWYCFYPAADHDPESKPGERSVRC